MQNAKLVVRRTFTLLTLLSAFTASSAGDDQSIVVQSTTSTANSGLYDHLLPRFTERTGIKVHVVAVGTGQAIKNAMNGDGDVLLVHAKTAEEKFVAEGHGVERFDLMYNDFVVVGPPSDPAGIAGSKNVKDAFRNIAQSRSLFASRGDNSGTHKKEIALWTQTGIDPTPDSGAWYRETGSGMGATLNTAIGMGAYTLTDRSTWIAFKNKQNYVIAVEDDDALFNQYGIMVVNPDQHPRVNAKDGQTFVDWMLGAEGQSAIAAYRLGGQQLFFPNAER
jgi:tungstate transport system substrate-binding protein